MTILFAAAVAEDAKVAEVTDQQVEEYRYGGYRGGYGGYGGAIGVVGGAICVVRGLDPDSKS